jgi:hypothetical protein
MKAITKPKLLGILSAIGLFAGINLLVASTVIDGLQVLAVPSLAVFLPSVLYGLR